MDDFARIQTFIKVVEAGSFSAAARNESSISSVARQVKSLEEELGIRLLNRSTRSLSLTEPGRVFYERVAAIAKDLGNAKREAVSYQESVKGVLRVSLRALPGSMIIVPALPRLLAQYPDLSFDVTLSDERCDLISSRIDVAVWMGDMPDSELSSRRLSPSRRIVAGAPSYLQRHGVPTQPADLRQHNCLVLAARAYSGGWRFTKDGSTEEVEVEGNLRTDSGLVLLAAAMAGQGLIVLHEWMLRSPFTEGRLVRVLGDYAVQPRPGSDAELHAVYPRSLHASRKVGVFLQFLQELFREPETAAHEVP